MSGEHQRENRTPRKRYVQLLLLVWVTMIGVDFFLHGGIFAEIYVQDNPFLLSAMEAFLRIPFGYLALLVTAGLLTWIINQASARGWRKGLVIGLCLGAVMGSSSALGLYSISTVSPQLLAAWFVAQVLEFAIAGAIIGQGLLVRSLRRLTFTVVFGFILLFAGTIAMQSVGLAPSIRIGSVPIRLIMVGEAVAHPHRCLASVTLDRARRGRRPGVGLEGRGRGAAGRDGVPHKTARRVIRWQDLV